MQDQLSPVSADAWVAFAGNVDWWQPSACDWDRLAEFAVAVLQSGDEVDLGCMLVDAECPVGAMRPILLRYARLRDRGLIPR
jgi:hypothetical protein